MRVRVSAAAKSGETKACGVCGREITWRKKWERDWEHVKYCSEACRRRKSGDDDAALERAIVELLTARKAGASICPSEAARRVGGPAWEGLMEPARMAARRLVVRGVVEITQGGRVVDPSRARGPIRVRRAGGGGAGGGRVGDRVRRGEGSGPL